MARQIGEVTDAWADLGPTQRLPSFAPPQRPSAKALEILGKLGLRYPPANSVDREAHAARAALLAEDCADIPDEWIEVAASRWAKREPFFPRTCELREDALSYGRTVMPSFPAPCSGPAPYDQKDIQDRDRRLFTAADWQELNDRYEQLGTPTRFNPDGSRYTIEPAHYQGEG